MCGFKKHLFWLGKMMLHVLIFSLALYPWEIMFLLLFFYNNVMILLDSWDHCILHCLWSLSWYFILLTLYNGPLYWLHWPGYILTFVTINILWCYKINYLIQGNSILGIYTNNPRMIFQDSNPIYKIIILWT